MLLMTFLSREPLCSIVVCRSMLSDQDHRPHSQRWETCSAREHHFPTKRLTWTVPQSSRAQFRQRSAMWRLEILSRRPGTNYRYTNDIVAAMETKVSIIS